LELFSRGAYFFQGMFLPIDKKMVHFKSPATDNKMMDRQARNLFAKAEFLVM
jgi:hypothetical protein